MITVPGPLMKTLYEYLTRKLRDIDLREMADRNLKAEMEQQLGRVALCGD